MAEAAHDIERIDPAFADLLRELGERLGDEQRAPLDEPPGLRAWVAAAGQSVPEFAEPIITPYVVPTVLAAFAAVGLHGASWPDAVTWAIRLGGDVDTLGAIVGALQGGRLGVEAIPTGLREGVLHGASMASLAERWHAVVSG